MSLNVFWFLPTGGDTRYLGKSSAARPANNVYLKQIATTAESFGYDGLLIPTGSGSVDPFITAATLANVTSKIKLLVALRTSAVGGPTVFARQAATLDEALQGRLILNVVPGAYKEELEADGVFLNHDERYEAADEFLTVWRRLLSGEKVTFKGKYYHVENAQNLFPSVQKPHPPLYFGGSSDAAHDLTAKHIDAYLSWGEPPHLVAEKIADVKKRAAALGRTVRFGIRLQIIVRETEEEAWAAANKLISHLDDDLIATAQANQNSSDSVGQHRITSLHKGDRSKLEISPNLWAGIGLIRGGAGTALVGDPKIVAQRLQEYIDLGADTFVLSGYPHLEEAVRFAELVFPLLPDKKPFTVENDVVTGGAFDTRLLSSNKHVKAS
ncbi:MAG: FMNH2-dependent alkanesulfonate monooxygenase [Campylobacteraceae bacterium]|jgi:alkanesulfonate monooxygenase|nr:FMNH2-dependent alkanesulfonate monooxygenase [Campylobacteraceae bacterium]